MSNVTIFGDGNMGSAIARILATGGASVKHITTADIDAAVDGELVVLAVPYSALEAIASSYGNQLAGKVVVDITNPVNFADFDGLVVPAGSSATAELAQLLPSSQVLKAFNTNFAGTLAAGTVGADHPTTVLVAGDDAEAKQTLISAITAGGVKAVDAGSLKRAHELEALGFLQMTLAAGEKIGWTGGFAVAS